MMLSGSLIPRVVSRLSDREISSVEACAAVAGVEDGAELNALYKVDPSGLKALPPTSATTLNAAPAVELRGKGRLLAFCCAITPRVAVSYNVKPAMKRDPSGDMDNMVDCPVTVRL